MWQCLLTPLAAWDLQIPIEWKKAVSRAPWTVVWLFSAAMHGGVQWWKANLWQRQASLTPNSYGRSLGHHEHLPRMGFKIVLHELFWTSGSLKGGIEISSLDHLTTSTNLILFPCLLLLQLRNVPYHLHISSSLPHRWGHCWAIALQFVTCNWPFPAVLRHLNTLSDSLETSFSTPLAASCNSSTGQFVWSEPNIPRLLPESQRALYLPLHQPASVCRRDPIPPPCNTFNSLA